MAAPAAAAAAGTTASSSAGGFWSGAGSQIGAAGISMSGTIANDILQNYYNKKAATKAYERTIEFWNKQNEYNSPKAQMARFAEAGLNPNLIYGQGSAGNSAPGSLDPSGTVATRRVSSLNALGTMAQIVAIENAKKQGELIDTQKSALDQKIVESQAKVLGLEETTSMNYVRRMDFLAQLNAKAMKGEAMPGLQYYSGYYGAQLEALRKRLEVMNKDIEVRNADILLKGDVHQEKKYYNYLRNTMGVEKGDNVFIRGGMSLFKKAADSMYKK